jgi:hypothetical protein
MLNDATRAPFVESMNGLLKEGSAALKTLVAMVQKIMKMEQELEAGGQAVVDEARQAVSSREHELKMLEIQGELENEATKQESLNEMRRVKTQEQMQIRREGVAADIELKRLRTQAEIDLKREAQAAKQGGQG